MGTGVTPKRIATGNTIWPFYRTNNLHLVLRASCPTSNLLRFFSVDSSLHMSHSCFKWFSKQVCFLIFTVLSRAQSLMTKQQTTTLTFSVLVGLIRLLCNLLYPSSLERRWSSRTFRYGYLVTTSPQLSVPPSAAPSFRLGHWLRALLTPMVWRAVCTRPGNVFTAAFWSAITSDSSFM